MADEKKSISELSTLANGNAGDDLFIVSHKVDGTYQTFNTQLSTLKEAIAPFDPYAHGWNLHLHMLSGTTPITADFTGRLMSRKKYSGFDKCTFYGTVITSNIPELANYHEYYFFNCQGNLKLSDMCDGAVLTGTEIDLWYSDAWSVATNYLPPLSSTQNGWGTFTTVSCYIDKP